MKLGFSNTILKQRGNACSGRLQNHLTQEGVHVKIKNQDPTERFFRFEG